MNQESGIFDSFCDSGNVCVFKKNTIYLFMRNTERREREKQRHRHREKQAPWGEPDVGFDPGSSGSRPGLKAALNPWATRAAPGNVFLTVVRHDRRVVLFSFLFFFFSWPLCLNLMLVFYELFLFNKRSPRLCCECQASSQLQLAAFLFLDNIVPLTPKGRLGLLLPKSTKSLLPLAVSNPSSMLAPKKKVSGRLMSFKDLN